MRTCFPFVSWQYVFYEWDVSPTISTAYFLNRIIYVWAVARQIGVSFPRKMASQHWELLKAKWGIFDVHGSVHSKCISKYNQQDAKLHNFIYFFEMLYMFQAVPPPIIRNSKLYTKHRVLFLSFTATCRHQPTLHLVGYTWKYVCDARTLERQNYFNIIIPFAKKGEVGVSCRNLDPYPL